jgi:hypothetical protein
VSKPIVTVQVPLPLQAPLQPANVEPALGVGVSVTVVPSVNEAEHVVPQSIAAGELVTVPEPEPPFVRVSRWLGAWTISVTPVARVRLPLTPLIVSR